MKTWAVILSKSNSKSASPENVFYKVVDEANLSSELDLASVLISFAGRWHKLCWFAACFNKRQFSRFFLLFFFIFATKMFKLVVHAVICSILCFFLVFHSQYASGCLAENFLRRKKGALVWAIVQTNIWSWSSTIAIVMDTDATAILMHPLITLYHYNIVQYHTFYHYLICLPKGGSQDPCRGHISPVHNGTFAIANW